MLTFESVTQHMCSGRQFLFHHWLSTLPNPALLRLLKVPHIWLALTHMMLTGWICARHGPQKTKVPTILIDQEAVLIGCLPETQNKQLCPQSLHFHCSLHTNRQ